MFGETRTRTWEVTVEDLQYIEAYPQNYDGIPLSEEWLIKFGVETWIIGNRFEIRRNFDESFTVYGWSGGESMFITHLKYVHQLQNLFFSLTGEELTIKQ